MMGLALGEETVYSKLNKLLLNLGELTAFVETHSEFAYKRVGGRLRIAFAWGAGAGIRFASASSLEATPSLATACALPVASDIAATSADSGITFACASPQPEPNCEVFERVDFF